MMDSFDDYSIITEEEIKELKESISNQDITSATKTIKEYLEQQDRVELNIAVTGESGSGKSTFVNAFRGLGDEDEDSAETGVVETTMEPKAYHHPKYQNVKLWDLPGIGTPNFKADEYLKQVQFERYDFFIIIASERFRECHIQLAKEIMRMEKKFYFVRSKIDQDINNERHKRNFDQKKILDQIRENCINGLKAIGGMDDPVVFLISGRELSKYDFNLLQEQMENELPQHKRHVLILSLPNITLEVNEKKKKALKKHIVKVALVSGGVAAVPVPGLSIAVDLGILAYEINKYCSTFGLDKKSLKKLCEQSGQSLKTIESLITSVWYKGSITGMILTQLRLAALFVTGEVAERIFSIIPIIGSVVAGGISFVTVYYMLNKALNNIAEDARKVLIAAVNTSE
ncbi:interferon-inducible GTPase 5-like isoform X1 [Misgurnus anguillicaudatus]|uniref:interferon-inducible GTPase 5-like isoform X1 n=2 Tax=Misgurnus anguillicaudatus TaxID=75329 RepID=UPI003CCEF9AE